MTTPKINAPAVAPDLATVHAKLARSNEHSAHFRAVSTDYFGDPYKYDLAFRFDHNAQEIHVTGRYKEAPPIAYLGAVFGDTLNCLRAALDHIAWALSLRFQPSPPPPHPIPRNSPWRQVGFPIVADSNHWNGAVASKIAMVDPALHPRFRELQPFVVNPSNPSQAWLQMLDDLWNIDKHRVVHVGHLTVALEMLTPRWRSDGRPIPCTFESYGPQSIGIASLEAETDLGKFTNTDFSDWPGTPDEMQMERGFRVNLFLDPSDPGMGKNMETALSYMHNAVVWATSLFEPEFV